MISKPNSFAFSKNFRLSSGWNADFSMKISTLFAKFSAFTFGRISSTISSIETNQENVKQIMKKLQDVPDDLDKCYETISELNLSYNKLTDLAVNPTGNYTGFSDNKTATVSDFAKNSISSSIVASKWSAETAPTSTAILELPAVNWSA